MIRILTLGVAAGGVYGVSAASQSTWAILCALAACAVCFLLGLAVGERSKREFCQELRRANRQLGEMNSELCKANLRMLQDARPSSGQGATAPGTKLEAS